MVSRFTKKKFLSIKKSVLIVANTTWNIYNFRLNVIQKLLDEGHQVMVLAPIDEFIEYQEKFPDVRHIGLRTLSRDSTNPIKDMMLLGELIRKYKRLRPDIIIHYTHKPNIYGGLAARWLGLKSYAVVTGLGYSFIHNGLLNKVIKSAYRWSAKGHRRFIFENEDDRLLFEKLNIILPDKGVSIKGCGVNTSHFAPQKVQKNDKLIFSFIGRILYDKGFIEFAEAAKRVKKELPHVEFHVIGEFDESNPSSVEKEKLVEYMDNDVIEYHGFTKDVRQYIAKSDCVVLPSYREAIARSLTEAMSMSVPVIATDVPGCREAVDDGNTGLLVEKADISALTAAMLRMASFSAVDRTAMGKRGRQKALLELDDQKVANDIYNIIMAKGS